MTTTLDFDIFDCWGNPTLSAYALSATPLRFVSHLAQTTDNSHRIIWRFGDGTTSSSFVSEKSYTYPGKYTVEMLLIDCNNDALISIYPKIVTIYDYIPFTFNVLLDEYVFDNGQNIVFKCGKIDGPFRVEATYPVYHEPVNIYYDITGSNSLNYWDIVNNKYSHIDNYHTLYDKVYNNGISQYQYTEIDKITLVENLTPMYAKLISNGISRCEPYDTGAFYVGQSSSKTVYFKDDSPTDFIGVNFFFDKRNYTSDERYYNNLGITLSAKVIPNTPASLSITSNGMDGEGISISSFNINPIKFFNSKIPFMVKIKDGSKFSIKNFDPIDITSLTFTLSSSSSTQLHYSISSLNYTLSGQHHGGVFRGYLYFPLLDGQENIYNLSITAVANVYDGVTNYVLSGKSSKFNMYTPNMYDIYKVNENFNAENTLRNINFQESMMNNNILFESFFGGILGGESTGLTHDDIGVKTYEKISNFVENTQDVYTCEIECLNSMAQHINYNNSNEEGYIYPEKIKRLLNIGSINKLHLQGVENKFMENFDSRGETSKTKYGKNLGNMICSKTYTVSAWSPIVALEKFSNNYSLLNTWQPVEYLSLSTYKLSSYSPEWGWSLVLPSNFDFKDIDKYYLFFEFNPVYDNTVIGGIIDYTNSNTKLPAMSSSNSMKQVFNHMFIETLYDALSVIN
jgi:hypothetical protein